MPAWLVLRSAAPCHLDLLLQKSGAAGGEQLDEEQAAELPAPKKRRVSGEEELQMDEQQVLGRATGCRRQGQRVHASLGVHIAPCGCACPSRGSKRCLPPPVATRAQHPATLPPS